MTISIIALAIGILGLLLKRMAKTPDILGYVSTMTRDNPHFEGPGGGERLDGVERAHLLRREDVKLMVVSDSSNNVGHVALASDEKTVKYRPITPAPIARSSTEDETDREIVAPESREQPNSDAISSINSAQGGEENDNDGQNDADGEVSASGTQPRPRLGTVSPVHT
jgi:hypothetical protein